MNHNERVELAKKMIKDGKSDNEMVDVFRKFPDFNERITRTQINFIRWNIDKFGDFKMHSDPMDAID
jgi:DNA primase large subunit